MNGTTSPQPSGPPSGQAMLLNAALESMPYGFSIWDEAYRLLLWNRQYQELYHYPDNSLRLGMPLREICDLTIATGNHPGITPQALFAIYRDRLIECTDPAEYLIFESEIGARAIKKTYMRMPGLGWVVLHEDVSEQKRRETVLRDHNTRFDAALNTMPYGFCIWDADLRLVVANSRVGKIYQIPAVALAPGASLADFFMASVEAANHPGRTAAEMHGFYRSRLLALGANQTLTGEEAIANGRTIKVTYRRSVGRDGWVATHEDVTEQKDHLNALQEREAALERQNMRFTAAVNNMSQGLCMFDNQRKLVICNERYADIYGLPAELVLPGTSLDEILDNRIKRGIHPVLGSQAYIDRRIQLVTDARPATDIVELQDGRVISIIHHPMRDGGWVSTHQDITEQRRNEERIRNLARHAALTDLPNRVLFRERMETIVPRIRRGEKIAVLCIDLDHFKTVNDTLGHAIGDALLKAVAARLLHACREDDMVARFGGDEFSVLHGPLANPAAASALADRIVKAMAEPFDIYDHQIMIGASVGIAVGPHDGSDADTLLKCADLALYRAKAEGRGAYHFFEKGMDDLLQERLALEVGLRRALTLGEFELVFQPLFSLLENRVCCLEALLRWRHPERGVVLPDEIIPVAEETGLIVPIGEWVLRQACLEAAKWPSNVRVAVNLSPIQFRNRHLTEQVVAALELAKIGAERLEVEITESALLAESELTLKTLHQLRDLGVRISMDDFGTGYSSLSYIRSFPFDKIKIDQSFVRDLASREDSLAIVKAVIGLGRSLGISTTAEGVETEAQLDLVRQQGCTEVQGFLFSRPLSASAIAELLPKPDGVVVALPRLRNAS